MFKMFYMLNMQKLKTHFLNIEQCFHAHPPTYPIASHVFCMLCACLLTLNHVSSDAKCVHAALVYFVSTYRI